jgi:hypothetical protein
MRDLAGERGLPTDLAKMLESRLCEKIWSALGRRAVGADIGAYSSQEGPPVRCDNIPELVATLGPSDTTLLHAGR